MRNIFFIFFICFNSFGQTATLESYGGQANNTGFNNASALSNALVALANGTISELTVTGGNVYNFDTQVNFGTALTGKTIRSTGTGRAQFFSDNLDIILTFSGNLTTVLIDGIYFRSTSTTNPPNTNEATLLRINQVNVTGLTINNCEFSAPSIETNGFKISMSNTGLNLDGLTISNSYFHDIGRMGFELVQHEYISGGEYEVPKYFNVNIFGNTVENVGNIQFGMGFSLSGPGQFINLYNNTFNNNTTTAVECIGVIDADIYNNVFAGNTDPVHLVKGSGRRNIRVKVHDNTNTGTLTGGFVFISGQDIQLYNNVFNNNTDHYFKGIEDLVLNNETYTTIGTELFTIVSDSPNLLTNVRMDNSILNAESGNVVLAGTNEGVVDISINCSEIRKSSGGSYLAVGGTANGTPSITYNNVERYSGGVLDDVQNPAGAANCLALPSTPSTPSTQKKRVFYKNFYDY